MYFAVRLNQQIQHSIKRLSRSISHIISSIINIFRFVVYFSDWYWLAWKRITLDYMGRLRWMNHPRLKLVKFKFLDRHQISTKIMTEVRKTVPFLNPSAHVPHKMRTYLCRNTTSTSTSSRSSWRKSLRKWDTDS